MSASNALNVFATPPMKWRRNQQQASFAEMAEDESAASIKLSKNHVFFGGQGSVAFAISWNVAEPVNPLDWIGMYRQGETNPFKYLDYKSNVTSGRRRGKLRWALKARHVPERNLGTHPLVVCFKYYDGLSGRVRAVSAALSLYLGHEASSFDSATSSSVSSPSVPIQTAVGSQTQPQTSCRNFVITQLRCVDLRRTHFLHCQYYAKLRLAAVSYKTHIVTNSTTPTWHDLSLRFAAGPTQEIQIFVKERNWSTVSGKLLGTVTISAAYLFDQHRESGQSICNYAFVLRSPNSKNQFSRPETSGNAGTLNVTVDFRRWTSAAFNGGGAAAESGEAGGAASTGAEAQAEAPPNDECIHSFSPEFSSASDDDEDFDDPFAGGRRAPIAATGAADDSSESDDEETMLSFASLRRRCRRSSKPEVDFIDAKLQPTDDDDSQERPDGLVPLTAAAAANHSSDSGISQCSQSADTSPSSATNAAAQVEAPTSVVDESSAQSAAASTIRRPSASCASTPTSTRRPRRPEGLPIDGAGASVKLPKVYYDHSSADATPRRRARAAVVSTLRLSQQQQQQVVCRACLVQAIGAAAASGKSGKCRCRSTADFKQVVEMSLPQNWEARVDRHGRVFFVDHMHHVTTWECPRKGREAATPSHQQSSDRAQRRQLERRYGCLRKTIGSAVGRNDSSDPETTNPWPAVKFLSRPDFVTFLHGNERASALYSGSASLRHVIQRVRRDPDRFERYLNHRELVLLLAQFADTSQLMPAGWEMRQEPTTARTFFVDHQRRRTTFIDPRLPTAPVLGNRRHRRARSAPPSDERQADVGSAYNDRVIELLKSEPFAEMLKSRLPSLSNDAKLQKKLKTICKVGAAALHRFANDVDVITVLSVFEPEISENLPNDGLTADPFEQKLTAFYGKLMSRGYGQGPGKIKLTIRRKSLLTDAYEQILAIHKRDLQRSRLCVYFDDEDGLDYGGPSREFFFLLSRELFNPYYGLFEYSANDTYTVQISPMSEYVDNFIEWFYFCGRVLGLALIHRFLIDVFFTRSFYKYLLRQPCTVSDLECMDSQFHSSLLWLQDNPVTAEMQLTFSVNEAVAGKVIERDLKPCGSEIPVCETNKADYIRRVVKWRLERGVKQQSNSLLRGFYEVVDPSLAGVFDARELELVLSGTLEIDIGDWRTNTEYKGGYTDAHAVVIWFWQAVQRFSNAQRLQLLQFVTGTSSIPYEGFSALRGSHGPKRFAIEKWGSMDSLPRAHTCFNRLDLPPYPNSATLFAKLLMAISESGCYGIE